MKSFAHPDFWKAYRKLPPPIRRQAREAFRLWLEDPFHQSLQFKRLRGTREPFYSVRIGIKWRAVGLRDGDDMVWF